MENFLLKLYAIVFKKENILNFETTKKYSNMTAQEVKSSIKLSLNQIISFVSILIAFGGSYVAIKVSTETSAVQIVNLQKQIDNNKSDTTVQLNKLNDKMDKVLYLLIDKK